MQTQVSKLNRFLGYFIDGIIASVGCYVFMFLAITLKVAVLVYLGYLVYVAFILLRDALGLSIGKKVMKYKVVKADGSSLSGDYVTSALRNVSLIIPVVNLVDCIFVLMDKPRLGDTWAKTTVVNQ